MVQTPEGCIGEIDATYWPLKNWPKKHHLSLEDHQPDPILVTEREMKKCQKHIRSSL